MIRIFIAFFALFAAAQAAINQAAAQARIDAINSPLLKDPVNQAAVSEAVQIAVETNCDPNICFALDGSGSISEDEFELQKDFVEIIAGTVALDEESQYAAIQYGLRPRFISRLTKDADRFLLDVEGTLQLGSPRTFIAPGIAGCMRQLNRVEGEANTIILLGDGRSTFDSRDPPLDPPSIAQVFLSEPNNSISAVAVSFPNTDMLKAITGREDRVFEVADWSKVLDVIAELVGQVCGADEILF
ncbi:von Willebrand factor A-like protein [Gracilaria domingensis]|nr:von Willebrand factor A-like protein [Gracilaria domingensis]